MLWAASRPTFPIAGFVDELNDVPGRLDAFDTGDEDTRLRAVFSWSYERLGDQSARLFRLLALHPGPDLDLAAAAILAGMPILDTRRAIGELTRLQLLIERVPGRYTLHDLLRLYAAEQSAATDPRIERVAAVRRMFGNRLHGARAGQGPSRRLSIAGYPTPTHVIAEAG